MITAAAHTIQYSSSRSEVWRWYWRAWAAPKGLWIYHVAFGLTYAAAYFAVSGRKFEIGALVAQTLACVAVCMIVLPMFPLLRFRSTVRTLTINPDGLKTTRGTQSTNYTWQDFRSIKEAKDEIVITSSGASPNAFIVPRRAFPDEAARQAFLQDAQTWHAQTKVT